MAREHREEDLEAIRQLKYRYFRALDCKDWDALGETLTDDCTTAYDSGRYSYEGRAAILDFLRGALGSRRVISMHHGHHPEITFLGEGAARGTWYLEDKVYFLDANALIRGAALYSDEYVRVGGEWKIRSTGYERTFEEFEQKDAPFNIRTRFDG